MKTGLMDFVIVFVGVVAVKIVGELIHHPISDELAWIMAFGWTILAKLRMYHED